MSNIENIMKSANSSSQSCHRTKKIREIFNLNLKTDSKCSKRKTKNYNREVFFQDMNIKTRDQISQLISEVINNSSAKLSKDIIKFNVNINNNFYNSNIDVIISQKERLSFCSQPKKDKNHKEADLVGISKEKIINNPIMLTESTKSSRVAKESPHINNIIIKPVNPIDNIYIPCLNCGDLIPYEETGPIYLNQNLIQ